MRDETSRIESTGARIVYVGSGSLDMARAFREDFAGDVPVLVDPDLRAYRAAGLRRGVAAALSPRLPLEALRAMRKGARQGAVEGDAWQLGGVLVIRPGGTCAYRHVAETAGDHAPVDEIVAALEDPDARADDDSSGPVAPRLSRLISSVVDPLVVPSFDRSGFLVHSLGFDPADLDVDLGGRRCVVTGANSGIGFETALALADLGAEVILLCRNAERGESAAERIRDQTGNRRVRCELADMSDLADVARAADRLGDAPLDVLVHNAGVLPDERIETAERLELTFATHVAGPWLLTDRLRPALEAADAARVVWVSSGGMYTRGLQTEDPQWEARPYDGVVAYAETKRAQVVLSELWAEAFAGTNVSVNAMHPGWADTPAVESSLPRFHAVTRAILRSPAEGADTVVWLAASPAAAVSTGRFFFDRVPRSTVWLPGTRPTAAQCEWLWKQCEQLAAGAPRRTQA